MQTGVDFLDTGRSVSVPPKQEDALVNMDVNPVEGRTVRAAGCATFLKREAVHLKVRCRVQHRVT
jgi:hypothetical protein